MTVRRTFLTGLSALFLLAAGFAAGYLAHDLLGPGQGDWPLLSQAYRILLDNGLKDPPPEPVLEYGMIKGMLEAYNDPYTSFVEPPQHELQTNTLQGSFGGIGADLGRDSENHWVLYPYPDSPAAEAGLVDGERLFQVDDLQVTPETAQDSLEAALRGPVGRSVQLSLGAPPDFTPRSVKIRRREFPIPSVSWRLDDLEPRMGIIKVNLIASSTPDEMRRAVEDLQKRGASAFLLDLRDNYGGLLTAGVDVARLFLKDGVVMEQQYRGREVESFEVERAGPFADLPLAVLINGNTASAAEIIAGALQARGRAELIGSHSFGKDTIQLVFNLQDGSSLHVTSARWWIPGLEGSIAGSGLQPDIPVLAEAGEEPGLQAAISELFGVK